MPQDPCCADIVGGEVYINAYFPSGGSARYEGLGDVRIQPQKTARASGASSAGRIWVTEAARPVRALLSFVNRCDFDPRRLWTERCRLNVTIVEKSRGFWHQMTRCVVVGDMEINLSTGEISGMEVVSDDYTYEVANVTPGNTPGFED